MHVQTLRHLKDGLHTNAEVHEQKSTFKLLDKRPRVDTLRNTSERGHTNTNTHMQKSACIQTPMQTLRHKHIQRLRER